MTEDRLAQLLTQATDLRPSADLRARVTNLKPKRRTSWLALSGVSATLLVVSFVLAPRQSAAVLLQSAEAKARNVSARFRMWEVVDGEERLSRWGIIADDWRRYESSYGRVELHTPTAVYVRDHPGERTLRSARTSVVVEDGLRLDDHLAFLRRQGDRLEVSMGETHGLGDERTEEVRIDIPRRGEREILTVDARELPIRLRKEAIVSGVWRARWRVEVEYPGPPPGSSDFWRGFER